VVPNNNGVTMGFRMNYQPNSAIGERYHFVDFDGHTWRGGMETFVEVKDGYRSMLTKQFYK